MEAGPRKRKIREDKKPSCDACRSQKLRCDASSDYSRPCSRCLKKQIACVVQDERRKKSSSCRSLSGQSNSPQHNISLRPRRPLVDPSESILIPQTAASLSISPMTSLNTGNGENAPSTSVLSENLNNLTEPQALGGVHVGGTMIDTCFARFEHYYAPLIPILSAKLSPNQTFRESPLKFWVIVAIGSRKCLEDPTLFSTLSPHVETLAMTSLCLGRSSPYPIIEAHLLMCSWHLSTDRPFWRSIYCTLSSAVVTLTLQAGMHHCLSLQGVFASAANPEVERGAKLWAYAVVLNQSAMAIHGYPINDLLASRHLIWGHECSATLPRWLVLQARIIAIVTKMHRVVSDLELETGLKNHSRTLKSLITASEAELLDLHSSVRLEDQGPLGKLEVAIARLQIRSFSFLITESDLDNVDRTQLSNAAITTMETVSELDSNFQISLVCPDHVFHGILLAACTLLKLLKSYPPNTNLDDKYRRSALFAAINIFKNISVVNNDIPAKVSEILAYLWSSPKVYRDTGGGYIPLLQVQNRFTMSVVFDCLWWWRKLITSPPNQGPYPNQNLETMNTSTLLQGEGEVGSFGQVYFDDWVSGGFDWDIAGSLNVQAVSNDQTGVSPFDRVSR